MTDDLTWYRTRQLAHTRCDNGARTL